MTHVIPGRQPVAEALRAGRSVRELLVTDADDPLARQASSVGIPVRELARHDLDQRTGGVLHQGVAAVAPDVAYATLAEVGGDLVVALDGITDPQNLGAIARSAEAAGASALVLPKRRSAHVTPAAEKAAAGAFSWLSVALVPNLTRAIADLGRRGLWSVGLAGGADTAVWDCDLLEGPVVIVVGAEGAGLSRLVAERCDALVAIPMRGQVGSLNASAATAIVLSEVTRRRR